MKIREEIVVYISRLFFSENDKGVSWEWSLPAQEGGALYPKAWSLAAQGGGALQPKGVEPARPRGWRQCIQAHGA